MSQLKGGVQYEPFNNLYYHFYSDPYQFCVQRRKDFDRRFGTDQHDGNGADGLS